MSLWNDSLVCTPCFSCKYSCGRVHYYVNNNIRLNILHASAIHAAGCHATVSSYSPSKYILQISTTCKYTCLIYKLKLNILCDEICLRLSPIYKLKLNILCDEICLRLSPIYKLKLLCVMIFGLYNQIIEFIYVKGIESKSPAQVKLYSNSYP